MLAIIRSPPLRVRRIFQYHLRGEPYSLVRDRARASTQGARASHARTLGSISAWVARCDDSPGAFVRFLEVSLVRVFPKRGKCVGLAGFRVNASLSRSCIPIDLWSRAYRQDMVPRGHHRIVTLTKPQIRNVDTVDEQVEVLESSKIVWPGHNQTSVILRSGRGGVRSGLSRLNWCACSKAACDCNHD
jgi:hypothetical protein